MIQELRGDRDEVQRIEAKRIWAKRISAKRVWATIESGNSGPRSTPQARRWRKNL